MSVGYSPIKKKIFIFYLNRPHEFFEQYNIADVRDNPRFSCGP